MKSILSLEIVDATYTSHSTNKHFCLQICKNFSLSELLKNWIQECSFKNYYLFYQLRF